VSAINEFVDDEMSGVLGLNVSLAVKRAVSDELKTDANNPKV